MKLNQYTGLLINPEVIPATEEAKATALWEIFRHFKNSGTHRICLDEQTITNALDAGARVYPIEVRINDEILLSIEVVR